MCGSKCNLMYSICNSLMYKMLYYQILCIRKICMCGKKPVVLLVTYTLHFNSSHHFLIYIFKRTHHKYSFSRKFNLIHWMLITF